MAAFALVLAAGMPAASASAAGPLEPDLTPEPASDLTLEYDGSTRSGLRLTTTIRNAGAGPLEVHPVGGADCDEDGDMDNDRLAYQHVFNDSDPEDGVFDPVDDTTSIPYEAGCMIYHPAHDHWHIEDFSDFALLTPGGALVSTTDKVSFCLRDTSPFDLGLPGAPAMGVYSTCLADSTEGISVGWRDIYQSFLPGQVIDIEGVPDGDYCVAVTSDPDDRLRESDDANNTSLRGIRLSGGNVIDSPQGCGAAPQPTAPQPTAPSPTATIAQPTGTTRKRRRCRGGKNRSRKRCSKKRGKRSKLSARRLAANPMFCPLRESGSAFRAA